MNGRSEENHQSKNVKYSKEKLTFLESFYAQNPYPKERNIFFGNVYYWTVEFHNYIVLFGLACTVTGGGRKDHLVNILA